MRITSIWVAMTLVLAGCNQLQESLENHGGGGGKATTTTDLHGRNPQMARDLLGEALVSAAQLHQALAIGRQDAARPAMRELRRKLADAGQYAAVDQQRRINQLEAAAIEIEGFMERQASDAVGASALLVRNLLGDFDTLAAVPTNGGGGGGVTTTRPAPAPATPRAVETFGPPAPYLEMNPADLLEERPERAPD
jgi:hypothetical protein